MNIIVLMKGVYKLFVEMEISRFVLSRKDGATKLEEKFHGGKPG